MLAVIYGNLFENSNNRAVPLFMLMPLAAVAGGNGRAVLENQLKNLVFSRSMLIFDNT